MAEGERPQRISIGFNGGQTLAARVAPDNLAQLRNVLGSGGWHELVAEDGTIALDLAKVAYVIAEHEEHRVGFGT